MNFEEPVALFGLQNPEVEFTGLVLKNITITGTPASSVVKGKLAVTFQNVTLNGKAVKSKADIPLRAESTIANAKHLP